MHCHQPVPDPRQFSARLPDAVCRVLARGLKKKPEERYSNARELLAALEALLASGQDQPSFGVPWEQIELPAPRRRVFRKWLALAGFLVGAAIVFGIAICMRIGMITIASRKFITNSIGTEFG